MSEFIVFHKYKPSQEIIDNCNKNGYYWADLNSPEARKIIRTLAWDTVRGSSTECIVNEIVRGKRNFSMGNLFESLRYLDETHLKIAAEIAYMSGNAPFDPSAPLDEMCKQIFCAAVQAEFNNLVMKDSKDGVERPEAKNAELAQTKVTRAYRAQKTPKELMPLAYVVKELDEEH